MSPDHINGLFECLGGVLVWRNVHLLHRDKEVKGVSLLPTLFFFLWGLWNLIFYPALGQWWSFWGGVVLVAANCVWWCQMLYYSRRSHVR